MRRLSILLCIVAFSAGLVGCGTTATKELFFDPDLKRSDVKISRVAIVPNRLPLNLQNPEKWRRFNWQVAADEFRNRGFDIVDYETSVAAFEKSGLPVEDTKESKDKYAVLAQELGVDAVVTPYYGTFNSVRYYFLVTTVLWESVVTFQVYLAPENEFFSRVDAQGVTKYTSNLGVFGGIGLGLATQEPVISVVAMLAGTMVDIVYMIQPDKRWQSAFRKAIKEGLVPFFRSFPAAG